MTYDADGMLASETDPEGDLTTYPSYDASGQPLEVVTPLGNATGNTAANRYLYRYDMVGNLVQAVDPRGPASLTSPLPASHDPCSPFTTTLSYDLHDRLTHERLPKRTGLGSCPPREFIHRDYAYDANGNPENLTNGNGDTTELDYDDMDLLVAEHAPAPLSETTRYAYDAEYALKLVASPKGSASPAAGDFETEYRLDDVGRRVASIRHSGEEDNLITSYALDRRDNLIGVVDPNRNATRTVAEAIAAARTPPTAASRSATTPPTS